ncbi:JAB domain-containing protein [Puia dinghuensis]|uniref:Helicase ATP-binding domain-containing protein n=1 Tax=Puia dinghuensis TaxID=1792502 RepID=A0A8J2UAG6_9BACT|nr:JAB domain-containing protein [Puia dinghuensis]GGA89899.1 hypothetical protein GCM10011511_11410 [Puia dinghuensis]
MKYPVIKEIVLGDLPEIDVPEIQVSYSRASGKPFLGKLVEPVDVANFIRSTFDKGDIDLQEQVIVLYLNATNHILGYYRHSRGSIHKVMVDTRIILGTALKCGCLAMIIAHNHPSGTARPSEADGKLTKSLKRAARMCDILLIDHYIITRDSYYSMADHGLFGLEGVKTLTDSSQPFVEKVYQELRQQHSHNKLSIEKMAAGFGITDKTLVKELTELAIVRRARELAHAPGTVRERFDTIVELYGTQVSLSHRTSQSMLLQQYSTPAPISYLAGVFCGIDRPGSGAVYFEPSAGNGLLTVAGNPADFIVNEIDATRNRNLQIQGFREILQQDATIPFKDYAHRFRAVLTNPPFGKLDKAVLYDTFPIRTLEQLMALRALDTMVLDGRAAIIIGGHTRWDDRGRIQAGRNRIFFNYLYSRYYVQDVINIDGQKLFARQGTAFDTRLILIDGRKKIPSGNAPVRNAQLDSVVDSFDTLFTRVTAFVKNKPMKDRLILRAKALTLKLKLLQLTDLGAIEDMNWTDYQKYLSIKEKYHHFKVIVLVKNDDSQRYETYGEDADRLVYLFKPDLHFSKAGFRKGRRIHGVTLPFSQFYRYEPALQKAGYVVLVITSGKNEVGELGAPYEPASRACVVLHTQVPDSMAFETQIAVQQIRQEVGDDMDNFVRHRLGYQTKAALCRALSAEQIDAVAMAIYNIEARGQGMIIGDQTGIGKGRVAAAMIRYGVMQGLKPVFLTEKANLFSDIYRDLSAIGSGHLRPFIVNSRESKTDIKDEDGNVVYQAPAITEQQAVFDAREVPAKYDFVVGTYSQFNSAEKKPVKPHFLLAIAEGNIFILDEAHNASGSSNTGEFLQGVVARTRGVVFLSATFAKRPDNMPIYAMKTAISDCNMSRDELVEAIKRGGVALQEVLSAQLVAEGQMIRRERSFEGVEVNYITLEEKAPEHKAIADNITAILRDIIAFQADYVDKEVEQLDKIAVAEGKEVGVREGTSQAGVDNQPYFSKVFQVINQMLFSLKAEAVAEKALQRLQEGKKPVIAFASTMGSFIETMENEQGIAVSEGDTINADFSEVLRRGLEGVLRYTERDVDGHPIYKHFDISDLSPAAQAEYQRILENIDAVSTGITISPIDVIIKRIEQAGYSVAEVTGRKYTLQLNGNGRKALVLSRKRINTNDAFRRFNNNEVDVLMINQSGSTGASAHAIPTAKVPAGEVRQRVMIVLQAELDISTEVQKRGRINRTGQILQPVYDYLVSAIPAEKRLMMMLQKKLKSLDANTTSNQKQSSKILDVPDFLNKYGDKIVREYLVENPAVNRLLDDPLYLEHSGADSGGDSNAIEEAAVKVSGRVAVLSTQMQEDFYNEVALRYDDYVDYLRQIGEYDLEVEAMNLETETVASRVIKMGKGGDSAFGNDSILETVQANVLKKPFTASELENLLTEALKGSDHARLQAELLAGYRASITERLEEERMQVHAKYDELIKEIALEKKIRRIQESQGDGAWAQAVADRERELNKARQTQLQNLEKVTSNRQQYLERIFQFFYVGRFLNYPVETYQSGDELVPAIFLGFMLDSKKKNPYAPSAIRLRYAIANSSKYLAIPASYSEDINAIIGVSADVPQPELPDLLSKWETYTKENNVDRRIRYIITGNLLQAFGDGKGKLVSYTTLDGQVKKGILLPEHWEGSEEVQEKVIVPILKALPLIRSLVVGKNIVTNNGVAFIRTGGDFKIIVPAARARGGDVYLDKEILALVEKNNFEKVSDKMVAILPETNLAPFVELLQTRHGSSLTIPRSDIKYLNAEGTVYRNRKPIELPPPEEKAPDQSARIRRLRLKAKALELKLKLLAA